jgi:hypothetical protein
MKTRLAGDLRLLNKRFAAATLILAFVISSGMLVACNSGSTALSSPKSVVEQHLAAEKNNDTKAWAATLTPDHDVPQDLKLGVTSLDIIEVQDETDSRYMEEALASEEAAKNGWTKDNYAFVSATYNVQYDNTLVPNTNGQKKEVFKLLRLASDSPWLIKDWGDARF